MTDELVIRGIRPDDVGPACDVLSRAFYDDPGALIVEPHPDRRRAACRALFEPVVRQAIPFGRTLVAADADGAIVGIATFLPAGHDTASAEEMEAAGLLDALAAAPDAAARMGPMVDYLEEQHGRAI